MCIFVIVGTLHDNGNYDLIFVITGHLNHTLDNLKVQLRSYATELVKMNHFNFCLYGLYSCKSWLATFSISVISKNDQDRG